MTPKLKAFFEVNTFNANRRRSLEFALNLYPNRIVHVIIQGEPGCQAHTSISEQICVITTVTFVKSWSNFVPKDAQAKLLIFVDGKCHIQPDAFAEFLFAHLNGAKVIYADSGVFPLSDEQDIFCKPSFSPELLLSFQYLGNVIGIDSELFTAFPNPRELLNYMIFCCDCRMKNLSCIFLEYFTLRLGKTIFPLRLPPLKTIKKRF